MSEFGMSKMEVNEMMDTNMEDVKMRSVEELIHNNISREDMTKEEKKLLLNIGLINMKKKVSLRNFMLYMVAWMIIKGRNLKS